MKKWFVFILAAAMAIGFAGTSMAVDYVVNLDNNYDYYASPVAEGVTVYVLASTSSEAARHPLGGATLFQLNPATGSSSFFQGAFNDKTATSAYGTPILTNGSGTGVTLVMNVFQAPGTPATAPATDALTGTSLWAVYFTPTNGGGVTHWNNAGISMDYRWDDSAVPWPPQTAGTSGYTTHLRVDRDGLTNGVSVYGTTGVAALSGASIWAISLGNVTGGARLTNNQWSASTSAAAGVSSIWAAPVISGNSLFVLGSYNYNPGGAGASSGVSLLMFDKRKLNAGPDLANLGPVLGQMAATLPATPFTTPAISGQSLFVVDTLGGLTAYNIRPNDYTIDANDFTQLGNVVTSSVTASPVANADYLAVCVTHAGAAGVTVFKVNGAKIGGAGRIAWWHEFAAGTTISATPAISDNNLFVAVNYAGNGSQIHRFTLNKGNVGHVTAPDQSWTVDANAQNFGRVESPSLIIQGGSTNRLVFIGNLAGVKRLYSLDVSAYTDANGYWRQFKFDAAGTANNTVVVDTTVPPDSDSGCFITTIK